jgi:hypothetical protein
MQINRSYTEIAVSSVFAWWCLFPVHATSAKEDGQAIRYSFTESGECYSAHFVATPPGLDNGLDKAEIQKLREVDSIMFSHHKVSPAELQLISKLHNVVELRLGDLPDEIEIEFSGLKSLSSMIWLEDLSVAADGIPIRQWTFLEGLQRLKHLSLTGGDVSDAVLKLVPAKAPLESVRIFGTLSDESAETFKKFPSLKELEIVSDFLTSDFITRISKGFSLKKIDLRSKLLSAEEMRRMEVVISFDEVWSNGRKIK